MWEPFKESFYITEKIFINNDTTLEELLKMNKKDIKKIFSEYIKGISNEEFHYIINTFYPNQKYFIKTKFSLVKNIPVLKITAFVLYLLKKAMNYDIIILDEKITFENSDKQFLIFVEEFNQYKNIGIYIENKIINIFNKNEIPEILYDSSLLIKEHLKNIIKEYKTLNEIIHELDKIIKITDKNKKLILTLIKNLSSNSSKFENQ